MNKKLYALMDWAEIEAITYSESVHPFRLLGPHAAGKDAVVQAFLPNAKSVTLYAEKSKNPVPMELMDESGYFACILKKKVPFKYELEVIDKDGRQSRFYDPYEFPPQITDRALKKFNTGGNYKSYEMLGAHPIEIEEVEGTLFSVWAPEAQRVSVVGDFNEWDGRIHEMERRGDSGVFEIFIPGVRAGALYKYEIKTAQDNIVLKSDPYAIDSEMPPGDASIVSDFSSFKWTDSEWMDKRRKANFDDKPLSIYEVNLLNYLPQSAEDASDGDVKAPSRLPSYSALARAAAGEMKDMGYTHICLAPFLEYEGDSWGYENTRNYFIPTKRHGSREEFAAFVDYMHSEGIGVIMELNISDFVKSLSGLEGFDGTALYENEDYRISCRPDRDSLKFDYSKTEVVNFMIGVCLFWADKYHIDGINVLDLAPMLYRDFQKSGDWVPNIYGGPQDLAAVDFLKTLTSVFHREAEGGLLIAVDSSAWPGTTAGTQDDGLGFDFKWNLGWKNDFLSYMRLDPIYRTHHYGELFFSLVYAYSEKFILSLSMRDFTQESLMNVFPGDDDHKFSCMKAALGLFLTFPGKKLFSMGQGYAEREPFRPDTPINRTYDKFEAHEQVHECFKDMMSLYTREKALYELDQESEGFEWINCISANENIFVYLRKPKSDGKMLLIVLNFENIPRKKYRVGVPDKGHYKEIFNTDAEIYGGFDFRNTKVYEAEKWEYDNREYSIAIKVPPLSCIIFECED